jgi:hypothetical protein
MTMKMRATSLDSNAEEATLLWKTTQRARLSLPPLKTPSRALGDAAAANNNNNNNTKRKKKVVTNMTWRRLYIKMLTGKKRGWHQGKRR